MGLRTRIARMMGQKLWSQRLGGSRRELLVMSIFEIPRVARPRSVLCSKNEEYEMLTFAYGIYLKCLTSG